MNYLRYWILVFGIVISSEAMAQQVYNVNFDGVVVEVKAEAIEEVIVTAPPD